MHSQILKPYHYCQSFAGTESEWWPTDTEERFQDLMQDPKHRAYFTMHGLDQPKSITYRFNQHGFRDHSTHTEFSPQDNNLVALGCSFTMGIGLPWHSIWPTLVGQALDLRVCNFGWGGASSDQCFRFGEYWIPKLQPRLVVLLNPPRSRLEIIVDELTQETETFMPMDTHKDLFVRKWLSIDANQRLNNRKNRLAIQAVCNSVGVPFLHYEADEWMSRSRETAGYARDYFHAGPEGHKFFTDRILDDWNQTKKS